MRMGVKGVEGLFCGAQGVDAQGIGWVDVFSVFVWFWNELWEVVGALTEGDAGSRHVLLSG